MVKDDDKFWIKRLLADSKASAGRLDAMAGALRLASQFGMGGDVVICGVWKGADAVLSRVVAPQRHVWLYDTFAGMTEPLIVDVTHHGRAAMASYVAKRQMGLSWCGVSLEDVQRFIQSYAIDPFNGIRYVVGDVSRTMKHPDNLPARICFALLDTDFYQSTKDELEALWPRMGSGSTLIVDDYGHWEGARMAVDGFFGANGPQSAPDAWVKLDKTAVLYVKP